MDARRLRHREAPWQREIRQRLPRKREEGRLNNTFQFLLIKLRFLLASCMQSRSSSAAILYNIYMYIYVYVCIYTEQVRGSVEGAVQETATAVTGGAPIEKGDRDPEPSPASQYIAPLRLLL